MNFKFQQRISKMAVVAMMVALGAAAQDHKWAGRPLDDFEWVIRERLAELPSYSLFDTVRFEVKGSSVILSGQVVRASLKQNAERMGRGNWMVLKVLLTTLKSFPHPVLTMC